MSRARRGEEATGLEELLGRLRGRTPGAPPPSPGEGRPDLLPGSAFEALLQERLFGVERGLDELKGRVNSLLFLVVGAVIVQLILGLVR